MKIQKLRVPTIGDQGTAQDEALIAALQTLYAPKDLFEVREQFLAIQMKTVNPGDYLESLTNFIVSFNEVIETLPSLLTVSQTQRKDLFLQGIRPVSFKTTLQFVAHELTLDQLFALSISRATEYDQAARLTSSFPTSSSPSHSPKSSAPPFQRHSPSHSVTSPVSQPSISPRSPSIMICHGCAHVGHIRATCPNKSMSGYMATGIRRNPLRLEAKYKQGMTNSFKKKE